MAINNYSFRSVVSADLALLSDWLKEPWVLRWFTGDDYINTLEQHLTDVRIRMQLVLLNDKPFAYVQDYDIQAWPDHHLGYLPVGSRGIDTFIGVDALIGKGHGTRYLSRLTHQLFETGVPALGIDPHPDNTAAISAYRNVGFAMDNKINGEWGSCVLMSLYASR